MIIFCLGEKIFFSVAKNSLSSLNRCIGLLSHLQIRMLNIRKYCTAKSAAFLFLYKCNEILISFDYA